MLQETAVYRTAIRKQGNLDWRYLVYSRFYGQLARNVGWAQRQTNINLRPNRSDFPRGTSEPRQQMRERQLRDLCGGRRCRPRTRA